MSVKFRPVDSPSSDFQNAFPPDVDEDFVTPQSGVGQGEPPVEGEEKTVLPTMDDLTPAEKKLAENVVFIYAALGVTLQSIPGNPLFNETGITVANYSEMVAVQWVVLARTNPTVKKWLGKLGAVKGGGGLLSLHALMLAPLVWHAGFQNPMTMTVYYMSQQPPTVDDE